MGIIQIPCLRSFGSCAYPNICDLLAWGKLKLTKEKIAKDTTNACTWVTAFGLTCGCPLRKVYHLQ